MSDNFRHHGRTENFELLTGVCRPVESGPFRPLVSTDTEAAPALSQAGEQSKGSCCSWNTTGNLSVEKDLLVALLPPDSSPSVNYSETSRPLHLPPLSSFQRRKHSLCRPVSALEFTPLPPKLFSVLVASPIRRGWRFFVQQAHIYKWPQLCSAELNRLPRQGLSCVKF